MRLVACLLTACLVWTPLWAAEDAEAQARRVTSSLVAGTFAAMTSEELDDQARAIAVRGVISQAFAFDIWERFLVGERGLSEVQLIEFRELLPGFLANLYVEKFSDGLTQLPEVTGSRKVRRDVMVSAAIPRDEGKPLPVDYRVRDFAERGPLVIDVMVGGISFLVLKRDEFAAMLEDGGPERLLAFMRENAM